MAWRVYSPELKERILTLLAEGRSVESVAREFGPPANTIHQLERRARRSNEGFTMDSKRWLRHLMETFDPNWNECRLLHKCFGQVSSSPLTR